MKQPLPLRPDQPLPAAVDWPHTLRPPTIQDCLAYHQIILQVHGEADARASAATREFLRLRAVSEAEAAKAIVPPTPENRTPERKAGWFKRIFTR